MLETPRLIMLFGKILGLAVIGVVVGIVIAHVIIWAVSSFEIEIDGQWVVVGALLFIGFPFTFLGMSKEFEFLKNELAEFGLPLKVQQYFAPFTFFAIIAMGIQIMRLMP